MVDPNLDVLSVIEADMAYRGTAALKLDESNGISLNIVEADEANKELRYLDSLGIISVESWDSGEALIVKFDPNLPPEIDGNILTKQ